MKVPESEMYCPNSVQEWRDWLEANHASKEAIWLVVRKKASKNPNLTWSEAVDQALCFGWIDSTKKSIDKDRYRQYFCKRKANSTWSKINKDKIKKLKAEGLMAEAGLKSIEVAKQNGSWTILDAVEQLIIPEDLEQAFSRKAASKAYFQSLSKSVKKGMLYWVVSAKRQETRQKRIDEIVEQAALNQKPKQFR